MGDKRRKNQMLLAFMLESRGEAPMAGMGGTEPPAAKREPESPAEDERLMEEVCKRENLWKALRQVQSNKGSPGVDGMKLKVNEAKSAVARPQDRKFLGFSFTRGRELKRRIAPKALQRFKDRVRELTRRTRGVSLQRMVNELTVYLRGWRGYFGFCQTPSELAELDSWVRRRVRCFVWKQWKHFKRRVAELRKRGVQKDLAAQTAGSSHGLWRISHSPALSYAMPKAFFLALGLPLLIDR